MQNVAKCGKKWRAIHTQSHEIMLDSIYLMLQRIGNGTLKCKASSIRLKEYMQTDA